MGTQSGSDLNHTDTKPKKKVNGRTSMPDIVLTTYNIQIHTNYAIVELTTKTKYPQEVFKLKDMEKITYKGEKVSLHAKMSRKYTTNFVKNRVRLVMSDTYRSKYKGLKRS